jgi:hypothetical protein
VRRTTMSTSNLKILPLAKVFFPFSKDLPRSALVL